MEATIFPPRIKKNFDYCAVKDCDSRASNLELRFHKFPRPNECVISITNAFGKIEQVDKLKAWKTALNINNITSNSKVCSLHFHKSDYILPDVPSKRKHLKKVAVPFLTDKNAEKNQSRLEKRLIRSSRTEATSSSSLITNGSSVSALSSEIITEETNNINVDCETSLNNEDIELNSVTKNNQNENNVQVNIESFIRKSAPAPLLKDFGMQVNSTEIQKPKFCDNISTDSELSTVTGIESFEVLNTIFPHFMSPVFKTQCPSTKFLSEGFVPTYSQT